MGSNKTVEKPDRDESKQDCDTDLQRAQRPLVQSVADKRGNERRRLTRALAVTVEMGHPTKFDLRVE
jgi:hypothetical protein